MYRTQGNSYVSDIGELRQVALDDGSSMLLDTATKAIVHLDETSRDIRLARGEALFEVAKDPKRPFVVHAGDVTVKAVGTAFSVRNDDSHVDVTVTEGVVELISNDGTPAQRLAADHRAVVTPHKPLQVQTLDQHEADRQLAWRTGRLEFDGQPLSEAAEEINRHSHRHIVVTNPSLAHHPIVGVFRSADAEGFAEIAAAALDAQVVKDGDTLRIEPKAAR